MGAYGTRRARRGPRRARRALQRLGPLKRAHSRLVTGSIQRIDDFALELANIWAGRVKYELAQMGIRCNISLPCLARNWPVAPPFHVSFEHEGTTVAVGVEWGGCFPPEETSLGDLEAATMILF